MRSYLSFDDESTADEDGLVTPMIMTVTINPRRMAPPIPADSPIIQSS